MFQRQTRENIPTIPKPEADGDATLMGHPVFAQRLDDINASLPKPASRPQFMSVVEGPSETDPTRAQRLIDGVERAPEM